MPVAFGLWSFVHGIVALVNRQRVNEVKGDDLQALINSTIDSMLNEVVHT